ncbi:MAG: hypothetical protein HKN04_06695 [Rhodothermaceae bacterium]|nr:hypothetical protein [Rhodothermaceae bacterium]
MRKSLFLLPLLLLFAACDATDSDVASANSTVTVNYTGTLEDGTVFDQAQGATFNLAQTIPGFRDGVAGMRIGEQRTFVVPPEQGYGAQGVPGTIPPNATLTFEVELVDVL